jgi:nitroimidazol reductase NimA-like FMN-containing flavoprotein (pyridoxamine 5'-phosphate oxidase superfamily)
MQQPDELYAVLRHIFAEQRYGILATNGELYPHTTIVCYVPADNLSTLLFVTPRPSRKFQFLLEQPHASLFVDNRSDDPQDLHEAYGIEARGTAVQVEDSQRATYRSVYLAKYPELDSFVDAESNAFFCLAVERYDIVHDFQTVIQLNPPGAMPSERPI